MDANTDDLFDAGDLDVIALANHFAAFDDVVIDGLKLLELLITRRFF